MLEPLRALIETAFSTSLSVNLGYSPRVVALSTEVPLIDSLYLGAPALFSLPIPKIEDRGRRNIFTKRKN